MPTHTLEKRKTPPHSFHYCTRCHRTTVHQRAQAGILCGTCFVTKWARRGLC